MCNRPVGFIGNCVVTLGDDECTCSLHKEVDSKVESLDRQDELLGLLKCVFPVSGIPFIEGLLLADKKRLADTREHMPHDTDYIANIEQKIKHGERQLKITKIVHNIPNYQREDESPALTD